MKAPDIYDSQDDWREYLRRMTDDEKQIQILKNAKFIQEFLKMLRFNKEIRENAGNDMKYDRLRQNYDIRNKSENELALYQKSQIRMLTNHDD